ncbi:MAG: hypothetical protein WCI02_16330 [Planctomycetota bacterium]
MLATCLLPLANDRDRDSVQKVVVPKVVHHGVAQKVVAQKVVAQKVVVQKVVVPVRADQKVVDQVQGVNPSAVLKAEAALRVVDQEDADRERVVPKVVDQKLVVLRHVVLKAEVLKAEVRTVVALMVEIHKVLQGRVRKAIRPNASWIMLSNSMRITMEN